MAELFDFLTLPVTIRVDMDPGLSLTEAFDCAAALANRLHVKSVRFDFDGNDCTVYCRIDVRTQGGSNLSRNVGLRMSSAGAKEYCRRFDTGWKFSTDRQIWYGEPAAGPDAEHGDGLTSRAPGTE